MQDVLIFIIGTVSALIIIFYSLVFLGWLWELVLNLICYTGLLIWYAITFPYQLFRLWLYLKQKKRDKLVLEERRRKQAELHEKVLGFIGSEKRSDYKLFHDDYDRATPKEREYRKHYYLRLLAMFDNCCANCDDSSNGVDLDHFIFPKYEGGTFMMEHKDGFKVNNAIPLCQSCNRSKGKQHYRTFFRNEDRLLSILDKNQKMTKILNDI